jgi:hypothetical protein
MMKRGHHDPDTHTVMAGLVPAIHVSPRLSDARAWMPGPRPGMTGVHGEAAAHDVSPPTSDGMSSGRNP